MLGAVPLTSYGFRGETVNCPGCEHSLCETVAGLDRRLKRLSTVMCERCGLLYSNPMPHEAELAEYYARQYRRDYQFARSGPSGKHRRKRLQEARDRMAKAPSVYEIEHGQNRRALDFGCGSGEMVETLLQRGFDAHGFDPGESYGSAAQTRLPERIRVARWQDVTYDAPFDLITCFHVLEHLREPVVAFMKMRSLLKPDGLLVIEVPDMGGDARKGIGSLHLAHVVGFNGPNLLLAAASAGLRLRTAYEPTGVVLEQGEADNRERLATDGLAIARAGYVDRSPIGAFVRYQVGKLTGGR